MYRPLPPALKALAAQIAGWVIALAAIRLGLLVEWSAWHPWPLVAIQAIAATLVAAAWRSAHWWLPIHLAFTPLLIAAQMADIAPAWYLAGFVALLSIYWNSFRGQVPLYLSNAPTADAVAALLPSTPGTSLLDLGSGTGSLLLPLARRFPRHRFTGIESAPAPYWLVRQRARALNNLVCRRGDFFAVSWSEYDVVYAFLSPVPMAAVWRKAKRDMRPGTLLISNSFAIPEATPHAVVAVGDRRHTLLYLYHPAGAPGSQKGAAHGTE